jgi:hypothetical protein
MPREERLLRCCGGYLSTETAASVHGLDCPVVGWSQRKERGTVMHYSNGWMGGGMWLWTVIGVLVVLLVGVINKQSEK